MVCSYKMVAWNPWGEFQRGWTKRFCPTLSSLWFESKTALRRDMRSEVAPMFEIFPGNSFIRIGQFQKFGTTSGAREVDVLESVADWQIESLHFIFHIVPIFHYHIFSDVFVFSSFIYIFSWLEWQAIPIGLQHGLPSFAGCLSWVRTVG